MKYAKKPGLGLVNCKSKSAAVGDSLGEHPNINYYVKIILLSKKNL